MVPFAIGGMAVFALAGVVLWIAGRTGWAGICLAGVLWGTVGLLVMIKHDAGRAARREEQGAAAASQTEPR